MTYWERPSGVSREKSNILLAINLKRQDEAGDLEAEESLFNL